MKYKTRLRTSERATAAGASRPPRARRAGRGSDAARGPAPPDAPVWQGGVPLRRGELHGPYIYVSVRTGEGSRLLYVPADAVDAVTRRVQATGRLDAALAEISAINLELLARGELA